MEMPRLLDQHAALNIFVGTWKGTDTMPPSPWAPTTTTADGRIINRAALGGFSVVQDYEQTQNGQVRYQGHGVFVWDAASNQYCMYWFDSMGSPVNEFRGNVHGQVWTFVSRDARGQTRSIWEFPTNRSYRHKMEVSPDGKAWTTFMQGEYEKIAG